MNSSISENQNRGGRSGAGSNRASGITADMRRAADFAWPKWRLPVLTGRMDDAKFFR